MSLVLSDGMLRRSVVASPHPFPLPIGWGEGDSILERAVPQMNLGG